MTSVSYPQRYPQPNIYTPWNLQAVKRVMEGSETFSLMWKIPRKRTLLHWRPAARQSANQILLSPKAEFHENVTLSS